MSESEGPFLKGYELLKIPVMQEGVPTWPEVFDSKRIEELRSRVGTIEFSTQMLLEPEARAGGRFDLKRILFYSEELECREANFATDFAIGEHKIISCSCFWDPSFATDGDDSVISCVYKSDSGLYFLHDIEYIKCEDEEGRHSAKVQCARVAEFARRNFCPVVTVEVNGVGRFLPEILNEVLARTGVACRVQGHDTKDNKTMRILRAFDAITAAGKLYIGEQVKNSLFMNELEGWSTDTKENEDGMDSVALALLGVFYPLADRPSRASRIKGKTFKMKTVWG